MRRLSDCAKCLREILPAHGFKLKSSTWRRDAGEFVDVVEFHRGRFSSKYAVHIGVLTKSVFEATWGEAPPVSPQSQECTVEYDLGDEVNRPQRLWQIDDPAAAADIVDLVRNSALPFFEEMHSREAQLRYIRQPGYSRYWVVSLQEAILMFELGDREPACTKLRTYKTPFSEDIDKHAIQIADRLSCPKL